MSIVAEIEFCRIPHTRSITAPDGSVFLCMKDLKEWFDIKPDMMRGWIVISDEWMPDSVLMRVRVGWGVTLWDPDQEQWITTYLSLRTMNTIYRILDMGVNYYVSLQVEDKS